MATRNDISPTRGTIERTDTALAARDSVAAAADIGSLVPRRRSLIHGGCSDMVAEMRHRRRERRRALAHARLRAA